MKCLSFAEKPEYERQDNADYDAGCDGEIEIKVLSIDTYVAGQFANKRYLVSYNKN